jgi:pilus assembly protein Flp/PilA
LRQATFVRAYFAENSREIDRGWAAILAVGGFSATLWPVSVSLGICAILWHERRPRFNLKFSATLPLCVCFPTLAFRLPIDCRACQAGHISSSKMEKQVMRNAMLKLYVKAQVIGQALKDEQGQDLVEYALVIAVVCLGIISGMNTLANGINAAMTTISTKLNTAVA